MPSSAYFKCSINKQTLNNENNVKISITFCVCVCVFCICVYVYVCRHCHLWMSYLLQFLRFYCYTFASDYFCLTYSVKYICMIIGFPTCRLKATFIDCCTKNKQFYSKDVYIWLYTSSSINQYKKLKSHILWWRILNRNKNVWRRDNYYCINVSHMKLLLDIMV